MTDRQTDGQSDARGKTIVLPTLAGTTFLGCSRAAYSVVCRPIWPILEYIQNIKHFLFISKFKKDQINSNREKVETLTF